MSCQQTREFLDAYIDKELDVVTTLQFERHLAECLSCGAVYRQYQELHDSVAHQIPYYEAPEALEKKIRAELRSVEQDRYKGLRADWFPHWRAWASVAAAVLLLVFGTLIFQISRRASEPQYLAEQVVSSHIRSLMANHLVDVPSSYQHTVKPWFTGKLDFAPVVKDLSSKGFPLVGGRLDYLDGRPVAALVYKHRQHTINLFIWPYRGSDSKPRNIVVNGYNVVHGTRSHMTYWAVSDLNAGELTDFTNDLVK
jgi:anti-sigma factor RsiW